MTETPPAAAPVVAKLKQVDSNLPPAEILAAKGLVKKGFYWLCPEEVQIAEHLTSLRKLERAYRDARRKIDSGLNVNSVVARQLKQARQEYDQLKQTLENSPNLPAAQKNQLILEFNKRADLINTYLPQVVDLDSGDVNPAFNKAMQELFEARNNLMVPLLYIRRYMNELERCYQPYADDPQVTAALEKLGSPNRLGPAKTNYDRDLRPLQKTEEQLFADDTPVYRSNMQLQLNALINDTTPATLTYVSSMEICLLSPTDAKQLGIEIPADAPHVMLQTEQGNLECRQVKLPPIRLGKHVLKDVDVLILPDAAPFPSALGTKAFAGYLVDFVPEAFRFRLRPEQPAEQPQEP